MRSLLLALFFYLDYDSYKNMIYQLNVCILWTHGLMKYSYDITTHRAKIVEASFLYFYILKLVVNYIASINLGKLVNQWDLQEWC